MSAIPGAIAAILADTQEALPGVQVIDGPFAAQTPEEDYVTVGWSPSRTATQATDALASFELSQDEKFDVPCSARSWSGDTDMDARRARAFELYEAVAAAVLASTRLQAFGADGVAAVASYTPIQSQNGCTATVDFIVRVEAIL